MRSHGTVHGPSIPMQNLQQGRDRDNDSAITFVFDQDRPMKSKQKQTGNATNATVPFYSAFDGWGDSFRICSASRRWANFAPENGFLEKAQADTRYATSMQFPRLTAQNRALFSMVTTMTPSLWHFIFFLRPY